ncbi:MAG: hypothetical protein FXF47_02630 [Candidatus Mcinerneyibacterium aminivorans]|uniref:NTP pyrophosphohydrolase MazG-like domain-containing protein n=1 Tax=Candidatus Mcinerneyibacterium aminivorans TaxID=2703815 RepID=A0A5D0MFH6_9BACT|nr:MAG: hypothetical protein FXF47_02630 [Candidatus Mcinerneyibacterium aminivorans]
MGKYLLDNIPDDLTVIERAAYISKKVREIGFDWKDTEEVFEKVEEEFNEINDEMKRKNTRSDEKLKEEVGDLVFSLINFSNFLGFDIRDALEITNKKFIERFSYVEDSLKNNNSNLSGATLEEMEKLWNKAKNKP